MHGRKIIPVFILLLVLLIGLLAACQTQPIEEQPFVVADLFATPGKILVTIALSPTQLPSPTIPNLPTPSAEPTIPIPTVVLLQPTQPLGSSGGLDGTPTSDDFPTRTPTPLACTNQPPMPFAPVWQNFPAAQRMMGCPVGEAQPSEGVIQYFELGVMFWRTTDRTILIMAEGAIRQGQETDSWWRVADTFQDGEPIDDPALQAPEGLRQPIRGFGKVWRSNGFIREALGWATTEETGITSLWQEFEGGWMMTGPDGQPPIYVLKPLDAERSSGIHLGPLP